MRSSLSLSFSGETTPPSALVSKTLASMLDVHTQIRCRLFVARTNNTLVVRAKMHAGHAISNLNPIIAMENVCFVLLTPLELLNLYSLMLETEKFQLEFPVLYVCIDAR